MSYLFVTGAHRSGTSLVCQMLRAHGVDFGENLAKPNRDNPHGYVENLNMRRVLKNWLECVGADRLGQWPFPPEDWTPTEEDACRFRYDVTRVLGETEAHKDPKMLPLWPLAHRAFPAARWLVVRRDPGAIARSCMATDFMRAFGDLGGWRTWALRMHDRMDALVEATHAVEVWPDPLDPESFRTPLLALGIDYDPSVTRAQLDPDAWGGP